MGLPDRGWVPVSIPVFAIFVVAIHDCIRSVWQDNCAAATTLDRARLPVYALLIGAFVPDRRVGVFNLRGLTLFALYVAGVVSAMGVAIEDGPGGTTWKVVS